MRVVRTVDKKAAALSDGVVHIAFVGTYHIALGINRLAGLINVHMACEYLVVGVFHKAYFAALRLGSKLFEHFNVRRERLDILFYPCTKREDQPREYLFFNLTKEITLILVGVVRRINILAVTLNIVSCSDIFSPHLVGKTDHLTKLDGTVAHDTRVGCQPLFVAFDKIAVDIFIENTAQVMKMDFDAKILSHFLHFSPVLFVVSGFFMQLHIDTFNLIALFLQQNRRYGRVNTAAHAYKHFAFWIILH